MDTNTQEIKQIKRKLQNKVNSKKELTNNKILELSQKLDERIVKYTQRLLD